MEVFFVVVSGRWFIETNRDNETVERCHYIRINNAWKCD